VAVPFNATIPAGSGVQNYGDVLVKESGGAILAWAIEGAVNFVRNGFKLDVPESVEEATEAYRQREDWLSNFIAERCVKDPNARVGAAELYYEYRNWAESTGDYTRRLNDFTAAMETAGYKNVRPKNKSAWIGLKIDLAAKFGNPCAASV
jgi:phage/plasmid-associated DNA primase